jgi:adenylyltransferase/sulfurtransferase
MNDENLLRYSRQIMLPNVGIKGQQILLGSTVLLIGLGGLGSPSALYLAAAGVGHLILADFDKVEMSNLQRQIIHHTSNIGQYKIDSAAEKLLDINPNIKITKVYDLTHDLEKWASKSDLVLDGTDNFKSRFAINKACVSTKTPLVSAAVIRFEGQLCTFKGYEDTQPCYQCLYPEQSDDKDNNCVDNGILSPVAGMLGSMQALQGIKVLLNLGEVLAGKLLLIDALDLTFRHIKIPPDKSCKICASGA